MFIIRSPFRIPLAGGGTDIPAFYKKNDGFLLSTTINKYIYLTFNKTFNTKDIILKYSKIEKVDHYSKIKHSLFKNVFKHFYNDVKGIEINCISDLPFGTGMGSSGSFLVALIAGLEKFTGKKIDKKKIAEMACIVEIDILKLPVGKQDQYSAAFGGLKSYTFSSRKTVVKKINIEKKKIIKLSNSMLLYYSGITRSAPNILKNEVKNLIKNNSKKIDNLNKVKKFAYNFENLLLKNDIEEIGKLMGKHWELKKNRNPLVTNKKIDNFYNHAMKNGAIGGKVLGAGGGGFILLITKNPKMLKEALNKYSFYNVPFQIENEGVKFLNEVY